MRNEYSKTMSRDHEHWVKLTSSKASHFGMVYLKAGLYKDIHHFRYTGRCVAGGLHFAPRHQIHRWVRIRPDLDTMWDVTIPADAKFQSMFNTKAKASSIVLSNPRRIPEEVWLAALETSHTRLADIPIDFRTPAVCNAAVERNPWDLSHAPLKCRDQALCELAVNKDGMAIAAVPADLCSEAMCLSAVQECGLALSGVPVPSRTARVCTAAVTNHGEALASVPHELRTLDMCRKAKSSFAAAVYHIPSDKLRLLRAEEVPTIIDNCSSSCSSDESL